MKEIATILVMVLAVMTGVFLIAKWLEARIVWGDMVDSRACDVVGFRVDKLDIKIRFFDMCPIYKPSNIQIK